MPDRVIAIIVAHDRRELLLECVAAVMAQSLLPEEVIVVDNASSDGSAAAVRAAFTGARVVELARNVGGAGGFSVGMALALQDTDADWLWVMDDDTVPRPDALAELLSASRSVAGGPAIVGSRVLWTDGRDHPMNTPRRRGRFLPGPRRPRGTAETMAVRSVSFVSILVAAPAVRSEGLPVSDYFIWNDDFEFSARLLRRRTGVVARRSVVVHKSRTFGDARADPGERFFYEVRNKIWLFRFSPALGPLEKPFYVGAAVLRWAGVALRSTDRSSILGQFARAWRVGMSSRPRSNEQVLNGLGVTDAVRSLSAGSGLG